MSRYKWYRKWKGGAWYYNRWWTNAGVDCFFWWGRFKIPGQGGNLCTLKEETYNA